MERLKQLRESKGLNQQGLAIKLNVSQSTISFYETGERTPDLEALVQIADFFGVSIDYLIGRSDVKGKRTEDENNADDMNFFHDYLKLSKSQKGQVSAFMQGLIAKDMN